MGFIIFTTDSPLVKLRKQIYAIKVAENRLCIIVK